MKLKMYLRGLGIGMIITAIVMGIALGGRSRTQATMSDEEIIARARELGMEDRATLMQYAAANSAASASLSTLAGSEDGEPSQSASLTAPPEGEPSGDGEELSGTDGEYVDPELVEGSEGEEGSDGASTGGTTTGDGTATTGDGENADPELIEGSEGEDGNSGTSTGSVTAGDNAATAGDSEEEELVSVNGLPQPIPAGTGAGSGASSGTSSSTPYFAEDDDNAEQALSYREDTEDEDDDEEEVLTGSTVVTIPKGVSSETASSHLAQAGVVDDAIAFNSYLVRNNYDRYIQSGTKQIPRGASYEDVAKIITGRR